MWTKSNKRQEARKKRQQELLQRRDQEKQKQKQFIEMTKKRAKKVAEVTQKLAITQIVTASSSSVCMSSLPSICITANGVQVIPATSSTVPHTPVEIQSPTSKMKLLQGQSRIFCNFSLNNINDESLTCSYDWPALYLGPALDINGNPEKYTIEDDTDDTIFNKIMSVHLLRFDAFPPEYPDETESRVCFVTNHILFDLELGDMVEWWHENQFRPTEQIIILHPSLTATEDVLRRMVEPLVNNAILDIMEQYSNKMEAANPAAQQLITTSIAGWRVHMIDKLVVFLQERRGMDVTDKDLANFLLNITQRFSE